MSRIVALDFETYYDTEYSLSKITMEEYIRGEQFEPILLTVVVDGQPLPAAWGREAIQQLLSSLHLEDKDTITVAHNMLFDGAILAWQFGIHPNMLLCTQAMTRECGLARFSGESLKAVAESLSKLDYSIPQKLDTVTIAKGMHLADMTPAFRQEYEKYCYIDTQICYLAFLAMLRECSMDGLQTIHMTMEMYTRPVLQIDKELLENYVSNIGIRRRETLAEIASEFELTPEELLKHIRSKSRFAKLLEKCGCEPPMKVSEKKTATLRETYPDAEPVMDYAFAKSDLAFQALLDHPDERVVALVERKLEFTSSIAESRAKRFLSIASRGALPVPLHAAKAHTGRYAATDSINLQNLPSRGKDLTLRQSIIAAPGYEIGGADSSQIEARLLAYAANEKYLLELFAAQEDPYSFMASLIFSIPYEEIKNGHRTDKDLKFYRNVGKEVVLASGYGMGPKKFSLRLKQEKIYLKPTKGQVVTWLEGKKNLPEQELYDKYEDWVREFHEAEARRSNKLYREQNKAITNFWRTADSVLKDLVAGGSGYFGGPEDNLFYYDAKHTVLGQIVPGIRLPNGYWILYYGLSAGVNEETGYIEYKYQTKKGRKLVDEYIYGGALVENLIQGLAFAILRWQAIQINQKLPVIMNVHDEWLSHYPIAQRDAVQHIYLDIMTRSPDWCPNVPLACEFSFGQTYKDCK